MPFIAYDLDAMEVVSEVAALAGLPEEQVGWGLPKLWRHCWRRKTDVVSADVVAGYFAGGSPRLMEALSAFGFAEMDGEQWRIRGAERYLRISAARSAAGKKRAGSRDSDGRFATDRAPATSQQTTSNQPAIAGEPTSKPPALSANSEQRTANSMQQQSTPAVAHQPSPGAEFFARCMEKRARELGDAEQRPLKLSVWFQRVAPEVGEERLFYAYCAYLADPFWRERRCPFHVFIGSEKSPDKWREYLKPLPKPTPKLVPLTKPRR
jgi:hypothetical protein